MIHDINELFRINGEKLYTKDYIVANNIPKAPRFSNDGWQVVTYVVNANAKKLYTADGVKTIYFYGEHTWFDDEKERDEYRAERNRERAEEIYRNKMLKKIMEYHKTLSTEELEKLVASL